MSSVLYASSALTYMFVIVIILLRGRTVAYKDEILKKFIRLCYYCVWFCFVDTMWGIFDSHTLVSPAWHYVFTFGFHMFSAISAYVWFNFLMAYLFVGGKKPVFLTYLPLVLLVAQLSLLFSNFVNGQFFAISSESLYSTGPLRSIAFYIQFSFYVITMIMSLFMFYKNREKRYVYAIIFAAMPLLTGILQKAFPDAPAYSTGFMFGCLSVYILIISEQREKAIAEARSIEDNLEFANRLKTDYAIINSLAGDYDYIFTVDDSTNQISNYKIKGIFREYLPDGDMTGSMLDECLKTLIAPEDFEGFVKSCDRDRIMHILSVGETYSIRTRVLNGSEFLHYDVSFAQDASNLKNVIIGFRNVESDVSARLEWEKELEHAKIAAEEANGAKSRFIFNMSHDIRTPMNVILGFTDVAKKHSDDRERVEDCLDKISAAGTHLLGLINEVLDMARIESGHVNLGEDLISIENDIIKPLSVICEDAAAKGIDVTIQPSDIGHYYIYGDKLHINQVAINILSNAVKYTKKGGKIDVSFLENSVEDGKLNFSMICRDTGIGMSEEFVRKIFDPFEREQNTTLSGVQGTGLGMSIVKQLVDLMGGDIRIESKLGVGTKVTIDFCQPIADVDKIRDQKNQQETLEADSAILQGKKALLVEDNELNREITIDILSDYGVTVDEAVNGVEAVSYCAKAIEAGPEAYPDFILMDIQMPLMDGYTATSEIRKLKDPYGTHIPIIAMTANAFDDDRFKAVEAGMDGYLPKPVKIEVLVQTLVELLSK